MKTLVLSAIIALFVHFSASAQYYYLPFINAGTNPGNIHSDGEFPVGSGLPAGWTTILGAQLTTWSANRSIPFPFQFNGSAVTAYKVSASGVLTFTTSATAVPSGANTTLPSASIPNNSILIWGLASTGTNDIVVSKTFGTAPNRQHWVSFTSYSAVGLPTTAWTYWSIVLEETSNRIYIVDQRTNNPQNLSLTLGLQINSTTAVQVFGSPNINSFTNNAPDPSDNTYYTFIFGTNPVQNDFALTGTNLPAPFMAPAPTLGLTIDVKNLGATTVSSFSINYTVNNGPVFTVPVTNQSLVYQANATLTPGVSFPANTPGYRKIKLWISGVAGDQNANNDTLNTGFTVAVDSMLFPNRRVLIEHFTSSTCAPCASAAPGWNAFLNGINANTTIGNTAVMKLQQTYPAPGTDLAATQEAVFRHNFYSVPGIPRTIVDGTVFNGSPTTLSQTPSVITNRAAVRTAFQFNLLSTYTGNTVNVSGGVTSRVGFGSDQIRVFMAIIENQYTNTAGGTTSETTFFKVLRKMLPGRDGLPFGTIEPNQQLPLSFNHTFSVGNVTQNSGNIFSNMGNLSLLAWVQHIGTKEVLQAHWQPITTVQGLDPLDEAQTTLSVYPNPAMDIIVVETQRMNVGPSVLYITDTKGAVMSQQNVASSQNGIFRQEIEVSNLPAGLYILRLTGSRQTLMQKLIIEK